MTDGRADAARQQGTLGQTRQDMQLSAAEALSGVGSKIQQRDQAGLDLAYKDFAEQRDWPSKQLSLYSQLLSGTPVSRSLAQTRKPIMSIRPRANGSTLSAAGKLRMRAISLMV